MNTQVAIYSVWVITPTTLLTLAYGINHLLAFVARTGSRKLQLVRHYVSTSHHQQREGVV